MPLAELTLSNRPDWAPPTTELRIPTAEPEPDGSVAAERADLRYVLEERYRRSAPPLSARLPFHYHRVPASLRRTAARLLQLRRAESPFPRGPIEPSIDALRWARGERIEWPEGKRCAVLLTHDVDTERGAGLIPAFAELERKLGVRSAFFVCSHHYPLDVTLLRQLEVAGFEVGAHGYNHDNRIAFLAEAARVERLRAISGALRPYVQLAGFRSPSLGRTRELFASLGRFFTYDSSVPDVDLEEDGGCATVLPYRLGSLLEIPITLPMESSLLYQGVSPREIFERWSAKLDWIRRVGGVATAVLHTEPQLGGHPELRQLYARWVAELDDSAWVTTPGALVAYLAASGFLACQPEAAADDALTPEGTGAW